MMIWGNEVGDVERLWEFVIKIQEEFPETLLKIEKK